MPRRQLGAVPSPISVFSARMPFAFLTFYSKPYRLDKKLHLPAATAALLRQHVAGLNGCHFCMDATRAYAIKESPQALARVDALPDYPHSPLFSDAERAALDYATELTQTKSVAPHTFARLARHYSERDICAIAWLVASEHLTNLTNIGLGIGSDGLCELAARRAAGGQR